MGSGIKRKLLRSPSCQTPFRRTLVNATLLVASTAARKINLVLSTVIERDPPLSSVIADRLHGHPSGNPAAGLALSFPSSQRDWDGGFWGTNG